MNPHELQPTSLNSMINSLRSNKRLINQMIKREVISRYKGSIMGLTWSFFHPIFMLTIYTFVFSEIFKARWGEMDGDNSKTKFAVLLFIGMIILNLFSEVLNQAPNLIIKNVNYVKKVVFPIEILPIISLGVALFHSFVSVIVLLIALSIFNGHLQWSIVFFPLILIPLAVFTLGLSWIFASLGVFIRDVGQTIGIITSILMFLSPVFYPLTAVPTKFLPYILANPLTFIIEQSREVLFWGNNPNWTGLGVYTLIAFTISWIGYAWFQKTRKGFSDVL